MKIPKLLDLGAHKPFWNDPQVLCMYGTGTGKYKWVLYYNLVKYAVKPVCTDHICNKMYYLKFFQ